MQTGSTEILNPNDRLNRVELLVSRALRTGVLISAFVIVAGLLLFFAAGDGGYPNNAYPTSFSAILAGTLALKPFAVILAGLVLLILTPVLRVAVSLLTFVLEQDWLYVGISALVLIILLSSFFFGK